MKSTGSIGKIIFRIVFNMEPPRCIVVFTDLCGSCATFLIIALCGLSFLMCSFFHI